jgi:hypothetical protein
MVKALDGNSIRVTASLVETDSILLKKYKLLQKFKEKPRIPSLPSLFVHHGEQQMDSMHEK